MADLAPEPNPAGPQGLRSARHERFDVLGVPVSATSLHQACKAIEDWAEDRQGRFVCVRDVHGVMRSLDDARLRDAHRDADMITPDGMPLVLLGKMHGKQISRTAGADLMESLLSRSPESGLKHYFYGGHEGVAETLGTVFRRRFPGLNVVGAECPPFRAPTAKEKAQTIRNIIRSGADVVWVGVSTPKQDIWMQEHRDLLPATLIGVGAAFDFHTGRVARAPRWMRDHGLEWLHRLCSEPRRLWRRYLVLAPKFALLTLRDILTGKHRHDAGAG